MSELRPVETSERAYVLLEDGTRFDGDAVGADGHAVGEVVFTTGMSGYQESMTDPSFAGQLITFTYPHIGNYGVSERRDGVRPPWARAAIMRAADEPRGRARRRAAAGCDWLARLRHPGDHRRRHPRARRHIRDAGAMRGGVFPGDDARGARRAS